MPPQEVARRASLETHVSNSAAARLLQPRAKGKGVGKGHSLRQARRRFTDLVKQPSLQSTPYGTVVKQLMVDTDSWTISVTCMVVLCMLAVSDICTVLDRVPEPRLAWSGSPSRFPSHLF